jgi:hypothetical protein
LTHSTTACRGAILILLIAALASGSASAQESEQDPLSGALRVFLDCRACDFDYLRREVAYVDYVRDRKDAEVHLLVTTRGTGGGGTEYTFQFIGLGRFAGWTTSCASRRSRPTRATNAGESTRACCSSASSGTSPHPLLRSPARRLPRAACRGSAAAQSRRRSLELLDLPHPRQRLGQRRAHDPVAEPLVVGQRQPDDGGVEVRVVGQPQLPPERVHAQRRARVDGSVARSQCQPAGRQEPGPHWAAAARGRLGSTTFLNQKVAARVGGGVEYNVFPYAESSRRALIFQLTAGINRFDYYERTVFDRERETVADALFTASLDMRQPWGSTGLSFDAAAYLHDPSRYRLAVQGDFDVRLFKGLSVNMDASWSRINNQLYLRAGSASDEEILLRRRQLATSYRYRLSAGLSYTFGSIFNNVVNPRF